MDAKSKRLLVTIVDDAAENDPNRVFAVIPKGTELSDGFYDLTMKELARAVNSMAWWIASTIGNGGSGETLAYMASNDARYCIFLLACQKTGYQAFFPSTRNSDEAFSFLLNKTKCSKFFFSEERSTRVSEISQFHPNLETFLIPTLKSFRADEAGLRHYPYKMDYPEVEDTTAFVIHSSGTTGMPKPVYITNGFVATLDAMAHCSWPVGREPAPFWHMSSEELILATTPFFHLMGFFSIAISIFHSVPVLIGLDKPLSVDYLTGLLQTARPTGALLPPSVLEDMCHSEKALESLRCLKSVYFGGAPLAPERGDKLRKYTRPVSVIGASEIGWILAVVPEDRDDWSYFEWNSAYGIDMQHTGDEVYEMVIRRQEDGRDFQGVFHTFPDIDAYHTNDLYTRHPTKPTLWKYHGRKDDVIVLSNGEKFNPVSMELIIEGHPLVSRALVIGQSRFQAGLLIEPNPSAPEMDTKSFIEAVWPTVQAANQTIAAHGRVMKGNIGFASRSKPFKTTPKGTTQRRAVVRDYEKEIEQIYQASLDDELDICLPETIDVTTVSDYASRIVSRVLERSDEIPVDQDLYSLGLDSLMTIQIAKALQRGAQGYQSKAKQGVITSQTVYANSTINQLAEVIVKILEGKSIDSVPRNERIQRMVEKYTADLPSDRQTLPPTPTSNVILTGSTGSLGTYLLHELLNDSSVSKIYCLNRSDAKDRQKKSLQDKGLNFGNDDWENKVEFLQASFGEPQFGIEDAKYQQMLSSVDTIVHNAWKVDFNHSVESFEETHIRGMRRFVDFSLASRCNAHIHFVSSISTVGGWSPELGALVPEMPMEDSDVVLEQGYGESKHIAERICLGASRRSQVPTTVYRVGQIAGPTTSSGQWNPHEWLPTIISTSKAMGKIPEQLGSMVVDWVPVDTLASIMCEIVSSRRQSQEMAAVFHLTNAEKSEWSELVPVVQEKYEVTPVEFSEWVADLESIQNPTSAEVAEKPALKLLDFYRGLVDEESGAMAVPLDVQKARQASSTMAALGPVSASLMRNWLKQWSF